MRYVILHYISTQKRGDFIQSRSEKLQQMMI